MGIIIILLTRAIRTCIFQYALRKLHKTTYVLALLQRLLENF